MLKVQRKHVMPLHSVAVECRDIEMCDGPNIVEIVALPDNKKIYVGFGTEKNWTEKKITLRHLIRILRGGIRKKG